MLTTLYSHCYTATCFSPPSAVFKKYWHVSCARSTQCVQM